MDNDNELEMSFLEEPKSEIYSSLLRLLYDRHLANFKSFTQRAINKRPPTIEINHLISHPINKTFLDEAASENLPDFIEFLLELGANPNLINPEFNMTPIHFAADKGNYEALNALLKDSNIQPNIEAGGQTALHLAIKSKCDRCVDLLLKAGASPNIPNARGLTALHFAAEKNDRALVQLILNGTEVLILDTFRRKNPGGFSFNTTTGNRAGNQMDFKGREPWDRKRDTARTIIEKKFPDIKLPKELENPDRPILLRYYLLANDEENFFKVLETIDDITNLENKFELLKIAIEQNLKKSTLELSRRGALEPDNLLTLGKAAVQRAHPEMLEEILKRNPKLANQLLLPASQELGVPAKLGPGNKNNRVECLKIILSYHDISVRQEDDKGNTPLHYATRAECDEVIEILLKKGSYLGHLNHFGVPALAHMAPNVLESHLNECLTSLQERSEDHEIVIDYRNLVPHNTECADDIDYFIEPRRKSNPSKSPCNETEALLHIARRKHMRHLLKHPVLSSFLFLKYLRIRPVLLFNFIFYCVYFIILNYYIWIVATNTPIEYSDKEGSDNNESKIGRQDNYQATTDNTVNDIFLDNFQKYWLLSVILASSTAFLVLREVLQFLSSPMHYISSPENWLELSLIGLTTGLILGSGPVLGAPATLLATWELVSLMAQHPKMSTNIEMFKTVTINFTRCLTLYIFLIFAFAFAFYVLFRGENFESPYTSIFKTMIMITGELDSGDLPFSTYPYISRIIFMGFIFLIVIILLNLLNGLAVNDTSEILAEAELVDLISRTKLVAYAEKISVGSPYKSKTRLCCCMPQMPFCKSFTTTPMRFMARRVLLFPQYLPQASLGVKPLKNYSITLHGRLKTGSSCFPLTMNRVIVHRAKAILHERDLETGESKILYQLNVLNQRFKTIANYNAVGRFDDLSRKVDYLEVVLNEIRRTVRDLYNRMD